MFTSTSLRFSLFAALLTLVFFSNIYAQQTPQTRQTSQTSQTPADNYATQTGFRSKVLEVRHRDPNDLLAVLNSLGSGFRGATLTPSREFKTLTVRDFPENIVTIEEALRRLDTPETPRAGIELRIHVLVASNTAEAGGNEYPPDLRDVIGQLKSTLSFKNYRLVNSIIQRTREDASASGSGVAEFTSPTGNPPRTSGTYRFDIRRISIDNAASQTPVVQIGLFDFKADFYVPDIGVSLPASINTAVSVRDGERVVVGTASLKDKALILVLSARVIK